MAVKKESKVQAKTRAPRSKKSEDLSKKLDEYALRFQKDTNDEEAFNAIHSALHKYIIGQAFHRFIIRGHEGKDLYQESLIVLWQKAIPSFDPTRGMCFFGFAKMCINRHLITTLHTAQNRKKDIPMNCSVSLDEIFGSENDDDDENGCSLQNIFDDGTDFLKEICFSEDKEKTLATLQTTLSSFESSVLHYYLDGLSYKEISVSITRDFKKGYDEKSVDNALLRIRRKAFDLMSDGQLPMFD